MIQVSEKEFNEMKAVLERMKRINKMNRVVLFVGGAFLGVMFLSFAFKSGPEFIEMQLPKAVCVENCVKERMDKNVFPDFQTAVKQCDLAFGAHEECTMRVER